MNKTILTLLSCMLFIFACSSDDEVLQDPMDTVTNTETDPLFLKEILQDGEVIRSYTYNDEKLAEASYYSDGEIVEIDAYTYVNDTTIVSRINLAGDLLYERKYYSISENVTKRDLYLYIGGNTGFVSYRLYNIDDSQCALQSSEIYDEEGTLDRYITYEYTDDNCSREALAYNADDELLSREEAIIDDKYYFGQQITLDFFKNKEVGNLLVYNRWDDDGEIEEDASYESIFEYNEDDYPISQVRTYVDGTLANYTYEYY